VILLDTSVLVDSLTGAQRSGRAVRRAIENGERLVVATLVLYEWLRGPRIPEELAAQTALFPEDAALAFGPLEASKAAELYRTVRGARGGDIDLAIAACAIIHEARLWTLNVEDFRDVSRADGPAASIKEEVPQ
jgi:predicted nucleic acid-binding protein